MKQIGAPALAGPRFMPSDSFEAFGFFWWQYRQGPNRCPRPRGSPKVCGFLHVKMGRCSGAYRLPRDLYIFILAILLGVLARVDCDGFLACGLQGIRRPLSVFSFSGRGTPMAKFLFSTSPLKAGLGEQQVIFCFLAEVRT